MVQWWGIDVRLLLDVDNKCVYSPYTLTTMRYSMPNVHLISIAKKLMRMMLESIRKMFAGNLREINWLAKANLPEPRLKAAAVASGDNIYLFGGELYRGLGTSLITEAAPDVLLYSNASNAWSVVGQMPDRRGHCSAVKVGQDVFVVGGFHQSHEHGSFLPCERVDVYNLTAESWVQLSDFAGISPFCGVAVIHGASIYALGGLLPGSAGTITGKVLRYDISTQQVAPVDTCAQMPTPRFSFATAVGKDEVIYTMGGLGGYLASDGTTIQGRLNTVEAYDHKTNTWKTCAPMNVARAELAAVTGPDGSIYALGGMAQGASGNWVERYDPVTDSWTEEPGFNQTRLYHAASLAGGNRIFVVGGQAQESCDGVPEVLASVEASSQPMP